jgi:hypothetical protein
MYSQAYIKKKKAEKLAIGSSEIWHAIPISKLYNSSSSDEPIDEEELSDFSFNSSATSVSSDFSSSSTTSSGSDDYELDSSDISHSVFGSDTDDEASESESESTSQSSSS